MARRTVGLGVLVAAAAAILLNTAQAGEGTETDQESCETSYYGCPCQGSLSEIQRKFHIAAPKGMSLVEGACTTRRGAISFSNFTYKGEMTLKGTITYSATEMGGDPVTFEGMYLDGDHSPDLNLPALSDKATCWAAPAVIKILVLEEQSGGDLGDGILIKRYEVLKLGEYKKCKLH